ncbi:MAG: hypothetical protein ABR575_01445, partial [Actinomycetota bacterium]
MPTCAAELNVRRFTSMKARLAMVILIVGLALPLQVEAALGASPQGATISRSSASASWTGGPFFVPHPACPTSADPLCDHFYLTVDHPESTSVTVAITADSPMFDYVDIEVYGPDGTLLASGARRWGYEELDFIHTPSLDATPVVYEIRVFPVVGRPGISYEGSATLSRKRSEAPLDYQWRCGGDRDHLDPVTSTIAPVDDRVLPLDVLVVVDGVDHKRARDIVSRAQEIYASIDIDLIPKYRYLDLTSEGADLMGEVQTVLGPEMAHTDVTY